MLHGAGIFTFTTVGHYHFTEVNVGKYSSTMDHIGNKTHTKPKLLTVEFHVEPLLTSSDHL